MCWATGLDVYTHFVSCQYQSKIAPNYNMRTNMICYFFYCNYISLTHTHHWFKHTNFLHNFDLIHFSNLHKIGIRTLLKKKINEFLDSSTYVGISGHEFRKSASWMRKSAISNFLKSAIDLILIFNAFLKFILADFLFLFNLFIYFLIRSIGRLF